MAEKDINDRFEFIPLSYGDIFAELVKTWATNAALVQALVMESESLSLGVINHGTLDGRKTSVLLSVDLAKLFEDKAKVVEKLTGRPSK